MVKWLKEFRGNDYDKQTNYHAKKWYVGNGYAFWMPDLRFLERDTRHMADFRPCEAGRPRPTKEQYVVTFSIISPYLEKPWLSPDSSWTKDFIKRMETWWYKDPIRVSPKTFITGERRYEIVDSIDNIYVRLRCSAYIGEEKIAIPPCRGDVWNIKTNLIIKITFPSEFGAVGFEKKWVKPVKAAFALADKWRQK